jgi:hypothetical protein
VDRDPVDVCPPAPDVEALLMLCGSIGRPVLVVSTSVCASPQMHTDGQSEVPALSWCCLASFSAVTPIGKGEDVGAAACVDLVLVSKRLAASALQLPFQGDFGCVLSRLTAE